MTNKHQHVMNTVRMTIAWALLGTVLLVVLISYVHDSAIDAYSDTPDTRVPITAKMNDWLLLKDYQYICSNTRVINDPMDEPLDPPITLLPQLPTEGGTELPGKILRKCPVGQ